MLLCTTVWWGGESNSGKGFVGGDCLVPANGIVTKSAHKTIPGVVTVIGSMDEESRCGKGLVVGSRVGVNG